MSWPSIQAPSFPLAEEVYKPQYKNEFEAGYVQSRPRATVAKRRWKLQWKAMTEADWSSLSSAFTSDQGSTFTWTHPVSGEYTVRYTGDGVSSTIFANGLRQVSVELEEAP
jgi:hypothetical protein